MNPTNKRFIVLNFVGGAFLLTGVVIGIAVLLDYFQTKGGTIHFDAQSKFQDLGTVLSGTAGLMFTIAGVLFFTYTLYQTSSEMRQTQNILSAQLSESTFFNLVKHHKDTYTDNEKVYSAFVGEVDKMFSKFEMFEEELNSCFFDIKTTRWQPNSILIEFNRIKNFSDSILHIIRYINNSLRHNLHFYCRLPILSTT